MNALEALGFYDITQEPSEPNVARLQRVLRDIEAAALRNNGPLARDHDGDALRGIGLAVQALFDDT